MVNTKKGSDELSWGKEGETLWVGVPPRDRYGYPEKLNQKRIIIVYIINIILCIIHRRSVGPTPHLPKKTCGVGLSADWCGRAVVIYRECQGKGRGGSAD